MSSNYSYAHQSSKGLKVIVFCILVFVAFMLFLIVLAISNGDDASPKAKRSKTPPKNSYDTVRFKYMDGDGNITIRTVDVITGKKGDSFRGYCHLRKEERTFYFGRIQGYELTDLGSGEILTPMEWRYRLQGTKTALAELEYERERRAHEEKLPKA